MAYGEKKDLVKRTQSDKGLKDKAFKDVTDPKYDGYQKDQLQWFIIFLIKILKEVVLLMNQIISWQMNFISQLLENFKKEKFIHFLETILGVLILLICNH